MKTKIYGLIKSIHLKFFYFFLSLLLLLVFCLGVLTSCGSYNLKKNLDPESKEFLSKVRYIITKKERKIFRNLAPEQIEEFIEEFWKRRDPDPYTEFNEFKEQYFRRIEEANRLFKGVKPGWLQDRGRTYVLLGPPDQRIDYPMGKFSTDKPYEVWYYGFFPIMFVDMTQSGEYELSPISAQNIAEINKAQSKESQPFAPITEKIFLDFNIEIKRGLENEVLFNIEVPYKNIWFVGKEGKLETTLDLSIEILNSENQKMSEHKKDYNLSLSEEEVIKGGSYLIKIPIILERGRYTIHFLLSDKTGEGIRRKKIELEI